MGRNTKNGSAAENIPYWLSQLWSLSRKITKEDQIYFKIGRKIQTSMSNTRLDIQEDRRVFCIPKVNNDFWNFNKIIHACTLIGRKSYFHENRVKTRNLSRRNTLPDGLSFHSFFCYSQTSIRVTLWKLRNKGFYVYRYQSHKTENVEGRLLLPSVFPSK